MCGYKDVIYDMLELLVSVFCQSVGVGRGRKQAILYYNAIPLN